MIHELVEKDKELVSMFFFHILHQIKMFYNWAFEVKPLDRQFESLI